MAEGHARPTHPPFGWGRTLWRYARWAFGRSSTTLPPWVLDGIQRGSFAYDYKGIPMLKNPFDLAIYPLLIWEEKPRTIIEIGSYLGASALWFADLQAAYGIDGEVYSLDIVPVDLPPAPRVTFMAGDAKEVATIFSGEWLAARARPILVVDDASHRYGDVRRIIAHFGEHLRSGEYLVIEDGNVADLGIDFNYRGGPLRAIDEMLKGGAPFQVDRHYCDFFGRNATWNVNGYLCHV